ncbi:hypothetical protein BC826DRAFT_173344 [Russula brevipes]|nr:hypothetical protein BC826DRAFT_173344 [Russula brevipes]
MTIAIVVHHSALVALASAGAAAAGAGDGDAPANVQPVPVPWDSWGPPVTRCLEVPYWRRCRGPVGQRWGVLAHDRLVMHDFNPHSVRRAVAQLSHATHAAAAVAAPPPGPGPGSSSSAGAAGMLLRRDSENGNRTRVVTAPTRLTAGLCFRGDVMSHLPYVETRAMCAPRRWESVLTDGERLFGLYFKVRFIFFFLPPHPDTFPSQTKGAQGIILQHRFDSSHPRPSSLLPSLQDDDADAHKLFRQASISMVLSPLPPDSRLRSAETERTDAECCALCAEKHWGGGRCGSNTVVW